MTIDILVYYKQKVVEWCMFGKQCFVYFKLILLKCKKYLN